MATWTRPTALEVSSSQSRALLPKRNFYNDENALLALFMWLSYMLTKHLKWDLCSRESYFKNSK